MTLVYLAAAWTSGIVLGKTMHPPWQIIPPFALLSLLSLALWRDNRRVQNGALCLLMLALGAGRFLLSVPRFDEGSLAAYNGVGWVSVEGVVVGEPDERDSHTDLRLRAERLALPDGTEREIRGLGLARVDRYPRHQYGDRVRVEGLLETPPVFEGFSYRDYLAREGIHSILSRARAHLLAENEANPLRYHLYALKRSAQETIAAILPEPQAALLTGILLGVETGIPQDLKEDFEATGTTHIIAISGFNMTIVSGIFAGLAMRLLDRRRALWVAIAGVALYTVFVGASPSVLRAALMGLLYLFGRFIGRESYGPVSLAAAAIVMTFHNPNTLWDAGFQLSFASTAGLMLYAEPLENLFAQTLARAAPADRAQQVVAWINEPLVITLAAQLTTLPVVLHTFGRLSLTTLLSNFLILSVQPAVMIAGGLATALGLVIPVLGRVLGWVAWVFLTYTIGAVRLTSQIPRASVPVRTEAWMVWAYYGLLAGLTWWLSKPRERRRELWGTVRAWLATHLQARLLIGASAILLVLALAAWRSLPDGKLHVYFLDVGQGDAILVQTPSGRQALIDGGPKASVLLSQLGRHMPFWDHSIDLVVLTHPDEDHISGLISVLERYRVDGVVWREMGCQEAICERWCQLLGESGATLYQAEAGLVVELDSGVRMDVLHPGAELLAVEGYNDNSVVTRLSYGVASMLLTGDITAEGERVLLTSGSPLGSAVLKAAHHGSCNSTSVSFLEAVDPEVVVISVGEGNEYGLPCDEVLERLSGRAVFRTDECGTVEVVSDGVRLWVETERAR